MNRSDTDIPGKKRPGRIPKEKKLQNTCRMLRMFLFGFLAAALVFVVVFARKICPFDPNAQSFASLEAPSLTHLAGTDLLGRDMLSRILVGMQTSVLSAWILVAGIAVLGTAVGVWCGIVGGIADSLLMRICDVFLALPGLVVALAIAAILGGGLPNAVIALCAVGWTKYARLARGQALSIQKTDYIAAAKLAGDTPAQLIVRHVLPNCVGPILVTAMLDIGTMMMELAGLSFLGLGAMPPTSELGSMMSSGRSMLQTSPWLIIGPGIAIFVTVAVFNLLGDAMRDYLSGQ